MEEYTTTRPHKSKSLGGTSPASKIVAGAIVLLIVAVGAFAGGVQYQKNHGTTTAATASSRFGGISGGPGGFARNGGFGAVTAVSATSITVSNQRTNSTKTYTIDGSTKITDNGTTVTYSDIQVGDQVIIRASSSTSTTATMIDVNPSFQGGPGGQTNTGTGTSSQDSQGSNFDSSI